MSYTRILPASSWPSRSCNWDLPEKSHQNFIQRLEPGEGLWWQHMMILTYRAQNLHISHATQSHVRGLGLLKVARDSPDTTVLETVAWSARACLTLTLVVKTIGR